MIWVLAETRDGAAVPATLEALGAAEKLSAALGKGVSAVLPGFDMKTAGARLAPFCEKVYLLEHELLKGDAGAPHKKAIEIFLKDKEISVIIAPGTQWGTEAGAMIAVSLNLPCVPNVTSIDANGSTVKAARPLYGGKLIETLEISGPAVILTMPRAFKAPAAKGEGAAVTVAPQLSAADTTVKVKEVTKTSGARDLLDSDVIVSGGRGVGGPEGFRVIEALADALNGAVGASRAAVDAGWADHSRQVGQTGQTVSPRLYVACGISGAPQHLAGMRTSRYVIAINKDPNAPMVKESDLAIIADLFEAIPELIKEIRAARG